MTKLVHNKKLVLTKKITALQFLLNSIRSTQTYPLPNQKGPLLLPKDPKYKTS